MYNIFKIVTDGEKFACKVCYKETGKPSDWAWLCENGGMSKKDSKQEMVEYIRQVYGAIGVARIQQTWFDC